jgi:hypothetical protein
MRQQRAGCFHGTPWPGRAAFAPGVDDGRRHAENSRRLRRIRHTVRVAVEHCSRRECQPPRKHEPPVSGNGFDRRTDVQGSQWGYSRIEPEDFATARIFARCVRTGAGCRGAGGPPAPVRTLPRSHVCRLRFHPPPQCRVPSVTGSRRLRLTAAGLSRGTPARAADTSGRRGCVTAGPRSLRPTTSWSPAFRVRDERETGGNRLVSPGVPPR